MAFSQTIECRFTLKLVRDIITYSRNYPYSSEYANFLANDEVSTLNKITETDGKEGYIFNRHDDHIVLHREITNKLHMSEDRE